MEKAYRILKNFEVKKKVEEIFIDDSLGRVLAEDVSSRIDVPSFSKSSRDGYAVVAEDTFGACEENPVKLEIVEEINAGKFPRNKISSGKCSIISTGAPIPEGADSVVMVEYSKREGDYVYIFKSSYPGEYVFEKGGDIKKGEVVLKRGTVVDVRDVGILSAIGISKVKVFKKPEVAVISSGEEIVSLTESLRKGKIYDVNSHTLCVALKKLGAEPKLLGIAADDKNSIRKKISLALKYDAVLLSGGVSVGVRDYVIEVFEEFGELLVRGVAVKPGKPTVVANSRGKLLFGLPGNPTSCLVIFYCLVAPVIMKMLGKKSDVEKVKKICMSKVISPIGKRQFLPVRIDGEKVYSVFKGSEAITSLKCNGFIDIPENVEFLDVGDEVEVMVL